MNPDFSQRAAVTADQHRWWASPQPGVERVMLDRLGGERGRATSLVRYAPGSVFPAHAHPGGEEILVLDGTFSDGSGHHGPGWYLRNPPGSAHQPSSADGALIFVKLWQMPADDTATVRINTGDATAWQFEGTHEVCRLHRTDQEHVSLLRLPPGHVLQPDARGGAELLVIAGQLVECALDDTTEGRLQSPTALRACEVFRRARAGAGSGVDLGAKHSHSSGDGAHLQRRAAPFPASERVWRNASQALSPLGWLRLAPGAACRLRAGDSGATVYLKTGHLAGLSA